MKKQDEVLKLALEIVQISQSDVTVHAEAIRVAPIQAEAA